MTQPLDDTLLISRARVARTISGALPQRQIRLLEDITYGGRLRLVQVRRAKGLTSDSIRRRLGWALRTDGPARTTGKRGWKRPNRIAVFAGR